MSKVTFVFSGALAPPFPQSVIRRDGSTIDMPSMFDFDNVTVVVECKLDELPTPEQVSTIAAMAKNAEEWEAIGELRTLTTAIQAMTSIF